MGFTLITHFSARSVSDYLALSAFAFSSASAIMRSYSAIASASTLSVTDLISLDPQPGLSHLNRPVFQ